MNYSDYSIDKHELDELNSTGKCDKLDTIFQHICTRLSDELATEAKEKGYTLKINPDLGEDEVAIYFMIDIPNASNTLQESLELDAYPYVVCLK